MVKGYMQEAGVDHTDTFALMVRHDIIRILIALSTQKHWPIFPLDVKSAFLNGILENETYRDQPKGFIKNSKENHVFKLKKSLYGLEQALRA